MHRLGVDRIKFPGKYEAGWRQKGFGRPPGAASHTAFRSGHCQVGPQLVYVGAGALYVSFLCQMGLFWMCNTTTMYLCISIVSSACFHVIPDLCPCNQ